MGEIIHLTAAILCGGASRRMGRDKARLPHPEGGTLLAQAARLAGGCADEVLLLPADPGRYPELGLRALADARAGAGPLGGLVAALREAPEDLLLLPVDLPRLRAEHLEELIAVFASVSAPALVARGSDGFHPTLSLWSQAALPAAEAALADGHLAMHRLLDALGAVSLDLPDAALANWNRPEDLGGC